MISLNIPGFGHLSVKHAVFDYNGTLARDGMLLPQVTEKLVSLRDKLDIHILTADTFGKVRDSCAPYPFTIEIIEAGNESEQKEDYIRKLGAKNVIAFGNGNNDVKMLHAAACGIVIIEAEGTAIRAVLAADLCVRNINEGLDVLLNPLRLKASLRF
jgi:soluble P-type ATPase